MTTDTTLYRLAERVGAALRARGLMLAPPFSTADFDILYGEGISREGEIIELGVTHRIVDKSGAWYTYGKERIGQGKDNTREYLKEHAEIAREIENKVLAAVGIGVPEPKAEPKAEPRKAVG